MTDKSETPLTEGKVVRRGVMGETTEPATVGAESSAAAVAALEAELTNLRLLIRRQDEVVERLLSERGTSAAKDAPSAPGNGAQGKRSSRRRILTQIAAGAAGAAAAAAYGVTRSGTASAEFFGTVIGASHAAWGIYSVPNGVSPIDITGSAAGVWGQADNNAPNPSTTAGVIGISNNFRGVVGRSNTSIGVVGLSSSSMGVLGVSTDGSGSGVRGVNFAGGGTGVEGESTSGAGVRGESNSGTGVFGKSFNQPGVHGESQHGLGVRGVSTNSTAMVGISTNGHGLYGSTSGAASAGFVGENLAGGLAGYFAGNVFVTGSLQVAGAKNAVIKMQDGTLGSVYCQESPEPYFEDFGRAQLVGGVASVTLEREFATLVAGGDYMVFLTPEGPSGVLYVSRRSAMGFEVRDPSNGSSSFTYRIVTKRKDIDGRRFARVVDKVGPGLAAARAAMGVGAPTSNQPAPQPPTQPQSPAPPAPQPQAPLPVQPPANNQPPPSAGPSTSGLIRP